MSVELRRARAEELAQMLPGTTAPFAVEIGASRRRRARALAPRQRHSPRPRSLFAGHLLRDPDARVRQSAVHALVGVGEAAAPFATEVAGCLADSDAAVRRKAAQAMGQLGAPPVR